MAIKLVRANSETPTVENYDDCRVLRYATGGYDGVVADYGNEFSYTVSGSDFTVNSGEYVLQGWQAAIDTSGVITTVDNISGTQYYVIYLEIDLSDSEVQIASIKSTYDISDYPTITAGDDLTTTPGGTARVELYRFETSSGVISSVESQFEVIEIGKVLNAENAINNTDGTSQKIYKVNSDYNSKLKVDNSTNDTTITQKLLIWWAGAIDLLLVDNDTMTITIPNLNLTTGKRYTIEGLFGSGSTTGTTNDLYFKLEFIYDLSGYNSGGRLANALLPLLRTSVHAIAAGTMTIISVANDGDDLKIIAWCQEIDSGNIAEYLTDSSFEINYIYEIIE